MIRDKKSQEEAIKWTFKPYRGVFPSQGSLANVPSGLDQVSKKGCRSQSLSSWACCALSYIVTVNRGSDDPPQNKNTKRGDENDDCFPTSSAFINDTEKFPGQSATNIPVYGTEPSKRMMSAFSQIQTQMYQMGRLHYIDHMLLSCREWDRYHTMVLPERVMYHCVSLVRYIKKSNGDFNLADIQRLIYGKEVVATDPPSSSPYSDDPISVNYPPRTYDEQVKLFGSDRINKLGKDDTEKHFIIENAFKLSTWLNKLQMRTEVGQYYGREINHLYLVNMSLGTQIKKIEYFDFRSQTTNSIHVSTLDTRVGNNNIKHCLHRLQTPRESKYDDTNIIQTKHNNNFNPYPPKKKWKSYTEVANAGRVPIRYMRTSMVPSYFERENGFVTSPTFNALSEKLEERGQAGSLGALVKRSIIRDPASTLSLIKTLQGEPSSAMDVAPLVRMLNMINSLDLSSVTIDLTPYQFMRHWGSIQSSVQIINKNIIEGLPCTSMYLDDFIDYIAGSMQMPLINGLQPNDIDKEWIAIPITTEIAKSRALIPYTLSFLDSKLLDGTINWVFRGFLKTVETEIGDDQGIVYVNIPASNTVRIPGAVKFVYVLVDEHDLKRPDIQNAININGVQIPVYSRTVPNNLTTNFNQIVNWWYRTDNYQLVYSDYMRAYSYFIKTNLLNGVQSLAMAMTAESRLAAKPGMFLYEGEEPNDLERNNYDWSRPVGGGWFLGKNDVYGKTQMVKNGKLHCMAGTLDAMINHLGTIDASVKELVDGYNFTSLSSWLQLPNGFWPTEKSQNQNVDDTIKGVLFSDTTKEEHTLIGYTIPDSTSLHRLATVLGLYERDREPIILYSCPTITAWSHMHCISIMSSMSIFLVLNNISLHFWSGAGTFRRDSFMYTSMIQIKNECFMNILHHLDTIQTLTDMYMNDWLYLAISLYYGVAVQDRQFLSSVPCHIALFIQWYRKTIEKDYPIESNTIWFLYNGVETAGYGVDQNKPLQKILAHSTSDLTRYIPGSCYVGDIKTLLGVWFESITRMSMTVTNPTSHAHADAFQVYPTTNSPYDVMNTVVDPRKMYILDSTSETSNAAVLSFTVTDLDWPDPPQPPSSGEYKPPAVNLVLPEQTGVLAQRDQMSKVALDAIVKQSPDEGTLRNPPAPTPSDPDV